jgi:glucose-specific phosphotransferase system IIA component
MKSQTRLITEVVAPLSGTVVALSDVPDPVFADAMIGPGLAILPSEPDDDDAREAVRIVVVAPCAGRMATVYPHAIIIAVDSERSVLVHLGVDTEAIAETCFDVVVQEGDEVVEGQPLLGWSPECVRIKQRSVMCPVVALQASADEVAFLVEPGDRVSEGQALLRWR